MSQNITPLLLGMMIMMMSSSFASAFLMMGGDSDDSGGSGGSGGSDDSGGSGGSGASGGSGESGGSGGSGFSGLATRSAAAAAAQPTEVAPVWHKKSNRKITGGTFLKYVDEGSLGPCKTECFADKECKGFTYDNWSKKCSLYGGDIDFKIDTALSRSSYRIDRQYE